MAQTLLSSHSKTAVLWLVIFLIAGCSSPAVSGPDVSSLAAPGPTMAKSQAPLPSATPYTLETDLPTQTATASIELTPSIPASPSQALVVISQSSIPTPTVEAILTPIPTAKAAALPLDTPKDPLEIRNLGPLSKVVSPIHLYGYIKTGAGSKARIELLGEDRRLLFGETKVFNVPEGGRVPLSMDIDFEIAAAAEAGRLKISISDQYDRVTAVNSIPLILLSLGDSDINPPGDSLSPIIIEQPGAKTLIQGGTLLVSGMASTEGNLPLIVRLLDQKGGEVGMRVVNTADPEGGEYSPFVVEVPYFVTEPTPALLVVSQGEASNTDLIHLSSVEILLGP